jgi:hypothetical protein
MTLVFAKERTLPALREALFAGRTAVWYGSTLIGKPEFLAPLFRRSVHVDGPYLRTKTHVFFRLQNRCDVDLVLSPTGKIGPATLTLPAGKTILAKVGTQDPTAPLTLAYTATNLWIAPEKGLPVTIEVPGK